MRSSGFDPNAGNSPLSSVDSMLFRVVGLYRWKCASFHSPSTKSRKSGTARTGRACPAGAGFARRSWHARRAFATAIVETGPSETRFERPPISSSRTQVFPPVGRTRTPRPGTLLSQTVYSRSAGRRRAMAASVSFLWLLAGMSQVPSTAPTVSAASAIIASAGWVYLRVVCGSA